MIAVDGAEHALIPDILSHQACGSARRIFAQAGTDLVCDDAIYFPVDAIASVSLARRETAFQVGFASRGDAIGIQSLFMPDSPSLHARVLKGGTLISVAPDLLTRLMKEDAKLKERLSNYAMRALTRYLDSAVCAATLSIERRVAQWISRYGGVLRNDSLPVTHQQMASALGVRRSGVTVALHVLEGEHLVRSKRARIDILDAAGLMNFCMGEGQPSSGLGGAMSADSHGASRSPEKAFSTV